MSFHVSVYQWWFEQMLFSLLVICSCFIIGLLYLIKGNHKCGQKQKPMLHNAEYRVKVSPPSEGIKCHSIHSEQISAELHVSNCALCKVGYKTFDMAIKTQFQHLCPYACCFFFFFKTSSGPLHDRQGPLLQCWAVPSNAEKGH